MWPQALCVASVWRRAVNFVYPVDPVCQVVLLSAAGSYVRVLITATRVTCGALADTHSLSPNFPGSVNILFASPKSRLFSSRSIKRSLKCFVFFCLSSLSVATRFLDALFNLCHFGGFPSFPAILPYFSLSLSYQSSSAVSAVLICVSFCPCFPVWVPAQI